MGVRSVKIAACHTALERRLERRQFGCVKTSRTQEILAAEQLVGVGEVLEVLRRPRRPASRHVGRRHAVERRVDLYGVEVFRVERQLVELAAALRASSGWVEDPFPRALAGRIAPA